ncbi:hypothetical protein E1B28_011890 [Marasmius oreades]|uniref:Uncharacterized protein n=1 Tax=Marasmius oreades TaxID=181124 RepID=A0A9P7RVN9_9AGAR|nr:uncharacterized protein E1B28_011890 [Marasmius oreades]KAG7090293.1 hypothetical protein E1B28_011890 [Marasmius oreades]
MIRLNPKKSSGAGVSDSTHLINTVWQQELAKIQTRWHVNNKENDSDGSSSVSDSDNEDEQPARLISRPTQSQKHDVGPRGEEEEEGESQNIENFLDEAFSGVEGPLTAINDSDSTSALEESHEEKAAGPSEAVEELGFEQLAVPTTKVPQVSAETSRGATDGDNDLSTDFSTSLYDDKDSDTEGVFKDHVTPIKDVPWFALEDHLTEAEGAFMTRKASAIEGSPQCAAPDTCLLKELVTKCRGRVTDRMVSQVRVEAQKGNETTLASTLTNDITVKSNTNLYNRQAIDSAGDFRKRTRNEAHNEAEQDRKRPKTIGRKICVGQIPKRVLSLAIWKLLSAPTIPRERAAYEDGLTDLLAKTDWVKSNNWGKLPYSGYDFTRLWNNSLDVDPYPGLDATKKALLVGNLPSMSSPVPHLRPAPDLQTRRQAPKAIEIIDLTQPVPKNVEVIDLTESPPSPPRLVARPMKHFHGPSSNPPSPLVREGAAVQSQTNPRPQTVPLWYHEYTLSQQRNYYLATTLW